MHWMRGRILNWVVLFPMIMIIFTKKRNLQNKIGRLKEAIAFVNYDYTSRKNRVKLPWTTWQVNTDGVVVNRGKNWSSSIYTTLRLILLMMRGFPLPIVKPLVPSGILGPFVACFIGASLLCGDDERSPRPLYIWFLCRVPFPRPLPHVFFVGAAA